MKKTIKYIFENLLCRYFYITRSRKIKSVYFNSWNGGYSDNPKVISEKLHELYPDVSIFWFYKGDKSAIPSYVHAVSSRVEDLKARVQSKVGVYNCYIPALPYVPKSAKFIQTWHGDRGFKKCGLVARSSELGKKKSLKRSRLFEQDHLDAIITGSKFGKENIPLIFGYHGLVLNNGCPRNDVLTRPDRGKENEIKTSLGIPLDAKILIFAPTYRQNQSAHVFNNSVNIDEIMQILSKKGENWYCLVRAHHKDKTIANIQFTDHIKNMSDYPDAADLLQITDFLISDYSSIAVDFALKRKPILLAMFDYDDYVSNSRELLMDIREVGFIIAYNQQELNNLISNTTLEEYVSSAESVNNYYGINETGNSSVFVVEKIMEWLNGK